jgi:hypothetical protein
MVSVLEKNGQWYTGPPDLNQGLYDFTTNFFAHFPTARMLARKIFPRHDMSSLLEQIDSFVFNRHWNIFASISHVEKTERDSRVTVGDCETHYRFCHHPTRGARLQRRLDF